MALEVCAGCSTRYAVGALRCPHCGSTERADGVSVGAVPPMVTVECTTAHDGCRFAGGPRRVRLSLLAPGVVELPTLLCAGCGSTLLITWPDPTAKEDDTMPKITVHGGSTDAAADTEAPAADDATSAAPDTDTEGGEPSSPGNSSSTSTEKPSDTPETSKPAPRKRTRAASPSTKGHAENSSAEPADTSGPETAAPTDDASESDASTAGK